MRKSSFSWRWRLAQFLELRWWQRYLRRQSPAEYLAAKRTYWDGLLKRLEWAVEPGREVLDAGCGPAGIFVYLHDRERVTALDPLLNRYESLDIFSRDRYPGVNFQVSPLEDFSAPQPFDAIYCINAINHVSDWSKSLDALTSLARPGTRLLLTSDVHRRSWLRPVFRLLPGDALHPQQHLAEEYRAALQARGWMVERDEELRREHIFVYRAWVCTYRTTLTDV